MRFCFVGVHLALIAIGYVGKKKFWLKDKEIRFWGKQVLHSNLDKDDCVYEYDLCEIDEWKKNYFKTASSK